MKSISRYYQPGPKAHRKKSAPKNEELIFSMNLQEETEATIT
ncbi:hypothetical protein HMPREF9176_1397 [Streptococcus downei F0415]|nr:hypothetical protein HMPREF9176_1397 [Streptococcus downei F0415]